MKFLENIVIIIASCSIFKVIMRDVKKGSKILGSFEMTR